MSKNNKESEIKSQLKNTLERYYNTTLKEADHNQIYDCLVKIVVDTLFKKKVVFNQKKNLTRAKSLHYLTMEILLGRSLRNSLFNLGLDKSVEKTLEKENIKIDDIYNAEADAGLGTGGLGRLAACFLDALATLNYPAVAHCILYEYGLFKQKLVLGEQTELPDAWLFSGKSWLQDRQDKVCFVKFGGNIEECWDEKGSLVPLHQNYTEVEAHPYDMILSGYDSEGISVLRLWAAKSVNKFDMKMFNRGDYTKAIAENAEIELISKVLYPADDHLEGKILRLKQQYFLVSASIQDIVNSHIEKYSDIRTLPELVAIHINDTHPALAIPELMRILMDEFNLSWDESWKITTSVTSYTNHTVLVEALEEWSEDLLQQVLPRIYQIIKEINRRFCLDCVNKQNITDMDIVNKMAIISKSSVKMANLSIIASHTVNGVSQLHSNILKTDLFAEFNNVNPNKFISITNGIAHRRWLCESNSKLDELLVNCIGEDFREDAKRLEDFKKYEKDKTVLNELVKIKAYNKQRLADTLLVSRGITVDPQTRFDVQIKRIHEYKRQLLNVMKIIYLYEELKQNPKMPFTPQTFFFGGKAASRYHLAKRIIKLINQLGKDIEEHPDIAEKLKVVFVENYNVTIAEQLIPASDISQQISLAGKEASGTSNMKFMMNGALTIGTYDGANIEISQECGLDNIFIFGMRVDEVNNLRQLGYKPKQYYENNKAIKIIINSLRKGFNGESFEDIANYLVSDLHSSDPYMCIADLDSYLEAHYKADEVYKDAQKWNKKCLLNIANAGYFSADRSIKEYVNKVWKLKKI